MNRLFSFCLFLTVLSFAPQVFAQQKWTTYHNARYKFSVSYPANLLVPRGEADNGDGQAFSGKAAEMSVFGSQMLLNETLLAEFNDVVENSDSISYKTFRQNFFVVSGINDDRIFYQKTIARGDGTFVTFYIQYDQSKRAVYDPITTRIAKNFRVYGSKQAVINL